MPLRPLKAGEPITEDWIADLVDAVAQALTVRGAGGLAVTRSGNGITIRNDKPTEFALVELNDTIEENDKDKEADLFTYDHTMTDPWSDTNDVLPLISDPDQGLRLEGERHLLYHNPSAGQWHPIPDNQLQFGKIYAQPGGAGQAYDIEVWKVTSTNTPPASQTTATSTYHVYAYQWGNQSLQNGTQVFIWKHRQSKLWVFAPGGTGTTALGTVTTKITAGTGFGGTNGTGVVELYNINGVDLTTNVTVTNPQPYPYEVGSTIRLLFDSATSQWYPLDWQIPMLGYYIGTSLPVGTTGTFTLLDDQFNTLSTLAGVRALSTIARKQMCIIFGSFPNAEFVAVPFNTPLIAQATAAIVYQTTGTVNVKRSDLTDPTGGVTGITALAFYRTIAKNEYCLVWWDYYEGVFYASPLNAVLLGQFTASISVSAGSTGTVELFKPNTAGAAPVDLSTSISNVRAVVDWSKYDFLWLVWDSNNSEFYGLPLDRPLRGKPTANILLGNTGSVAIYDSTTGAPVATGDSVTVSAAFCDLYKTQFCLVAWDWKLHHFYATPISPTKARFVWVRLLGTLDADTSTFSCSSTLEDFGDGSQPSGPTIILPPPGDMKGSADDYCFAVYDPANDQYVAAVILTLQTVVTDVQWDGTAHKLQKKTRQVAVCQFGAVSAWTDIDAATTC
jgi:hypothetical protein